MNAAARVRREQVRIQAATMFEESKPTAQIASELRVSEKSVRDWRRRWAAGGTDALASAGPGASDCKLSTEQQKQLAAMLDDGPVVHGWDDARWTLARVAELIERRFGVCYTLRGVSLSVAPPGLQPAGPDPPGDCCRSAHDWLSLLDRWPAVSCPQMTHRAIRCRNGSTPRTAQAPWP